MLDHPRIATVALAFLATVATTTAQTVTRLSQLSFVDHPLSTPDTEWGELEFLFHGPGSVHYLNVHYDGAWVVRNQPILGVAGDGVEQTQCVSFDLRVARGVSIAGQTRPVGCTLTPELTGDPGARRVVRVDSRTQSLEFGIAGHTPQPVPPAPQIIHGATAPVVAAAANAGFPPVEAGDLECVPSAVVSSLEWLKQKYPRAPWGDRPIDLDMAKEATGWMPRRNPIPPGGYTGAPQNWGLRKDRYMRAKKYPVRTRVTRSFEDVQKAIEDGCDVEITTEDHCGVVTGITKDADGRWKLTVSHDSDQDGDGGWITEVITVEPGQEILSDSSSWWERRLVKSFTIECVEECYLMAGFQQTALPVFGDPNDVLRVVPAEWWGVTLDDVPEIPIANDPSLNGLHFYFQVLMDFPRLFPDDPVQLTEGLDVEIGGPLPTTYGTSPTGMHIRALEPARLGGAIRIRFSIPGF